ncbi:MAG: aminopeptidase [Pseudomonadota bacterium]
MRKLLLKDRRPCWDRMDDPVKAAASEYAARYRVFLDRAKTEREGVEAVMDIARDGGFVPLVGADPRKKADRFLWTWRGKMVALLRLGKNPAVEGFQIVAAHLDSPRLDLKPTPLYEAMGMAWLKTHYYGGIKKYQWVTTPLALHGVVIREDGSQARISIGEEPGDPVFTVTDLLPHLSYKVQGDKRLAEAIPGEKLNILFGGLPIGTIDDGEDRVKLAILDLMSRGFKLTEDDFVSAELELVPAGSSRDVGLDRAFVGGYGQDDRASAFAAVDALLAMDEPEHCAMVVLFDKEEIGSEGDTGAQSRILELLVADALRAGGERIEGDTILRTLSRSRAISADVTAGIDPSWESVHDTRNDARMGHGICLTKYTGSRGKSGANDAHAEFVGRVRRIWDDAGVLWQAGEMGKVDEGGGGTVAKFLAALGMEVLDAGPPLLSMHSPFEIAHKADLWMSRLAYEAFLKG